MLPLFSVYKNKYIAEINHWRKNQTLRDDQIFERLWAIEKEQILWTDIPPGFEDLYDLPHRNDYGIDLINLEFTETSQVKHYGNTSTITWTDMSKYSTYSKDLLNIQKLNLLTTPDAKIDKMVTRLFKYDPECIQRESFQNLLQKIPEQLIYEDNTHKCSIIEQRPYLVFTSESILKNPKDIINVQWPCGSGKTYLALDLYQKLKSDKIVLFVTPWRSLANQILEECVFLGINAGIIGDGNKILNKSWKFVICITASIHLLPNDLNISYKFGDEAHHFEYDGIETFAFNNIISDKTIFLSATFHNPEIVDYRLTKRDAIKFGIIADYKIHLQYYTGGRFDAILKMVKENIDWIPIAIYFNTTENAISFYKLLLSNGILAQYLTGESTATKRITVKEQLTNGLLSVVCLCGVWNEGESIHILRTVIFGDLRHSSINIRQVSQRGSRKHPSKPFYNIVLPIDLISKKRKWDSDDEMDDESDVEMDDEKDLQQILKYLSDEDSVLKKSIQNRSFSRIVIRLNNEIVIENTTEQSTLLYNQIFNSIGMLLENNRITPEEKVTILLKDNKIFPKGKKDEKFSDGTSKASFWSHCKRENKCVKEPYIQLLKIQCYKEDWDAFTKRPKKSI